MEDRGGQLKIHSTISKKARGAFLTALIENQVQTVEEARRLKLCRICLQRRSVPSTRIGFVREV